MDFASETVAEVRFAEASNASQWFKEEG